MLLMSPVFSQPPGGGMNQERREKMKALKVEYITSKLDLSSAEAEKFWPVYNEFSKSIHGIEKARRDYLYQHKDMELSDEKVNELIQYNFDTDQKVLDLKIAYDAKFKKVLSIQKVGKLYMAEDSFKMDLLRKMRGRSGPPPHE